MSPALNAEIMHERHDQILNQAMRRLGSLSAELSLARSCRCGHDSFAPYHFAGFGISSKLVN